MTQADFQRAWASEKKNHLGDYGDASEIDIYSAFKAGWKARIMFELRGRK